MSKNNNNNKNNSIISPCVRVKYSDRKTYSYPCVRESFFSFFSREVFLATKIINIDSFDHLGYDLVKILCLAKGEKWRSKYERYKELRYFPWKYVWKYMYVCEYVCVWEYVCFPITFPSLTSYIMTNFVLFNLKFCDNISTLF